MRTSRSLLIAGAIGAVLLIALILVFQPGDRNVTVAAPSVSPSPTVSATVVVSPTASPTSSPCFGPCGPTPATAAPTTGAITGRFGYPSDFIPPVTVYAISVADPKVFFFVDFAGFGNPPRPTLPPGVSQPTYTLTGIAPGTYYVIAYRNDGGLVGPAGYSQYTVQCYQATTGGQNSTPAPGCATYLPALVPVVVHAGETVSRIDVVDWLGPRTGYPQRPPNAELNGYQFSAHLVLDPSYGAQAADAAHFSGLEGVGLVCTWTRTGADVASALELFGTPPNLSELAGYAPLKTGTTGGRTGGFPRSAADDRTETHVVCGMRDDQGAQGVEVVVHFVRDGSGRPTVTGSSVRPWRGN
jgi:hypothetical protein